MRYFVKLAGKAFGPLEEEKIVEMYQAGRLKDPVEISRDKKTWDSIEIILPPPPLPDLPPVEPLVPQPAAEETTQKFVDPNAPVWYYSSDGSKGYGPVTKSDLATMIQCGMLKASSLVWRQGENSRPISVAPELTDVLQTGASLSSSAGVGGETFSASSVPPIPDNPFNDAFSYNSTMRSGMGDFRPPTGAHSQSNTNMFDLLDDPNFDNNALGQGRASNRPSVGQISRASYMLLALFLGQLGIHNFYASRMDIAIVQLFIGLSNLVGLIVILFVSLATEGQGKFLFIIPAIIGLGLEIWAITEACIVTNDGSGKRMY